MMRLPEVGPARMIVYVLLIVIVFGALGLLIAGWWQERLPATP
jgi:hypothetical protein